MSNLMKLFGTLMAVLGVVLGVTILAKPGLLDAMGIRLDTAVLLLVGGVLALGLGSVIDVLKSQRARPVVESVGTTRVESAAVPPDAVIPNFSRKPAETAAMAAGAAVASATMAGVAEAKKPDPVAETISALEQAKADVIKSMGGMDAVTTSSEPKPSGAVEAPKPAAALERPSVDEEEPAADEEADEDLYVVEEKVIRGRPARILSDDTVEAETDEGWMRFENLEHLNEYLDSVEEQAT